MSSRRAHAFNLDAAGCEVLRGTWVMNGAAVCLVSSLTIYVVDKAGVVVLGVVVVRVQGAARDLAAGRGGLVDLAQRRAAVAA